MFSYEYGAACAESESKKSSGGQNALKEYESYTLLVMGSWFRSIDNEKFHSLFL